MNIHIPVRGSLLQYCVQLNAAISAIAPNEISLRVPRTNERRPDARYTTNLVVDNIADSSYHGGQFEFETGLGAEPTPTLKGLESE